jgi:hypothetical protein
METEFFSDIADGALHGPLSIVDSRTHSCDFNREMRWSVNALANKVKSVSPALHIDLFEFVRKCGQESMSSCQFVCRDLFLEEDTKGGHHLAKVTPIELGKNIKEHRRSNDVEVLEELPCLVAAVDLLSGVPRRTIKGCREIFCSGCNGCTVFLPNITFQHSPRP